MRDETSAMAERQAPTIQSHTTLFAIEKLRNALVDSQEPDSNEDFKRALNLLVAEYSKRPCDADALQILAVIGQAMQAQSRLALKTHLDLGRWKLGSLPDMTGIADESLCLGLLSYLEKSKSDWVSHFLLREAINEDNSIQIRGKATSALRPRIKELDELLQLVNSYDPNLTIEPVLTFLSKTMPKVQIGRPGINYGEILKSIFERLSKNTKPDELRLSLKFLFQLYTLCAKSDWSMALDPCFMAGLAGLCKAAKSKSLEVDQEVQEIFQNSLMIHKKNLQIFELNKENDQYHIIEEVFRSIFGDKVLRALLEQSAAVPEFRRKQDFDSVELGTPISVELQDRIANLVIYLERFSSGERSFAQLESSVMDLASFSRVFRFGGVGERLLFDPLAHFVESEENSEIVFVKISTPGIAAIRDNGSRRIILRAVAEPDF